MAQIPSTILPDSTLALGYEGYTFISKRCNHYDSDIFQTRFLFRPAICMRGEEAARLFYDNGRFERQGAVPGRVLLTLFGVGGVQGLDDDTHRNRKQMFMKLMSSENIDHLMEIAANQWHNYAEKWKKKGEIILFEEMNKLLCQTVCEWAGVPLKKLNINLRAMDFAAMIDGPAAVGIRYLKARVARQRTQRWVAKLIKQVRNKELNPPEGTALQIIAAHRDLNDELLDTHTAAVEVINILRPTIAVSRFIMFAALALHEYPEAKTRLQSGNKTDLIYFVQEVRRFYPFFPFAGARVRKDFNWKGYHFPAGRRTLLDLYGTNHHPDIWEEPEKFRPERFRNWEKNSYNFIPQGGGDYYENHRCPGERIAIELMKTSIDFLLNKMQYKVPDQNLTIRLSRMPAIPHSRFIITNVERVSE
jgi:fatty-acid peroxygenase